MSFGRLLGKHAWIGLALAVAMLLLSVMVGGILVVRGVIPAEGMTLWVVAGCGLAAAAGGCAERGGEACVRSWYLFCCMVSCGSRRWQHLNL